MTVPTRRQPQLPPNTIVPVNDDLFIPYFNRLYEEIAYAVNSKDHNFFPIAISSTPENIVNLPSFGAFLVCVSGITEELPTLTASLCKSSSNVPGTIAVLGSQLGTGAWAGKAITITSTATFFQISHNLSGITGNFNIRIIGTQAF